jgi:hypothetical protein
VRALFQSGTEAGPLKVPKPDLLQIGPKMGSLLSRRLLVRCLDLQCQYGVLSKTIRFNKNRRLLDSDS